MADVHARVKARGLSGLHIVTVRLAVCNGLLTAWSAPAVDKWHGSGDAWIRALLGKDRESTTPR